MSNASDLSSEHSSDLSEAAGAEHRVARDQTFTADPSATKSSGGSTTPDQGPFVAFAETLVETPAAAALVAPADAPQRADNIGVIRDLLRKLEEAAAETSQSIVQLKPAETAVAVAATTLPQVTSEPGLSALRRSPGGDAAPIRPLDIDVGPISLPSPASQVAIAAPRQKRGKGAAFAIGFTSFALGVAAAAAVIVTLDPIKSWKSAVTTAQVMPAGPLSRAAATDQSAPVSDVAHGNARVAAAATSAPSEARGAEAKPDAKAVSVAADTTSADEPAVASKPAPAAVTAAQQSAAGSEAQKTVSQSAAHAPATLTEVPDQGAAAAPVPPVAQAVAQPAVRQDVETVARTVPFSVVSADRIEIRPGELRSLALRISPLPVHTDPLLIVLRGVPSWLTISKGSTIGDEIWLLPAHQAGDLAVSVIEGAEGASEIKVQVAHLDGRILAESRTMVRALRPVRPSPLVAAVPEAGEQSLLRMLARGELLLDTGEVESARLLLRTAAEGGSVAAALKLAQTYDPGEMRKLGMADASADPALAVRWYERAQSLGSPIAAARLAELSSR